MSRWFRIIGCCVMLWCLAALTMACGTGTGPGTQPGTTVELKINELLTKSSAENQPDWIEIYNPTEKQISLAGLQLKDSNSGKIWTFPEGQTIAAKGFLQVICDDSGTNGRANFKLSSKGETITLQTAEGKVIDEVSYPEQTADVSWGRESDGGGKWKILTTPSPGKSNG